MTLPFATQQPPVPSKFLKLQSLVESEFRNATLHFYMNGKEVVLDNPNPDWTLLDFIRSRHGFKGTKLGCGEGGCGACTVVLQSVEPSNSKRLKHVAVNACLFPLIGGEKGQLIFAMHIRLQYLSCWQTPHYH